MGLHKKGKIVLFLLVVLVVSSCAGGRKGSFRRIKGHKVWIPGKSGRIKPKYERCYNFPN